MEDLVLLKYVMFVSLKQVERTIYCVFMIITLYFLEILVGFDDVSKKAIQFDFFMRGLRKSLFYNIRHSLGLELGSTLIEFFECLAYDLAIRRFEHNNKIKKTHHNITTLNQHPKILNNIHKYESMIDSLMNQSITLHITL